MDLEEALEVFPYLHSLVGSMRHDWKKLSLIEKAEAIGKINEQCITQSELVIGTWRAQEAWLKLSRETQKEYDEFVKTRRGRPMTLNNPLKVQKWMREQLDEQRFYFLFKDIIFQLKRMDVKQTHRELEALHVIYGYLNEINELMSAQMKRENKRIAANIEKLEKQHQARVLKKIRDLQKETGIKVVKVRM